MPVLSITGVYVDGSAPAGAADPRVPTIQNIRWPEGESGVIKLAVVNTAGAVVNLTGHALRLAVRRRPQDTAAVFTRLAALTTPASGLAQFTLTEADTVTGAGGRVVGSFRYDVMLILANGNRFQLVPVSRFEITPIVGRPGEPAT